MKEKERDSCLICISDRFIEIDEQTVGKMNK